MKTYTRIKILVENLKSSQKLQEQFLAKQKRQIIELLNNTKEEIPEKWKELIYGKVSS
jgi:hypothetical protein